MVRGMKSHLLRALLIAVLGVAYWGCAKSTKDAPTEAPKQNKQVPVSEAPPVEATAAPTVTPPVAEAKPEPVAKPAEAVAKPKPEPVVAEAKLPEDSARGPARRPEPAPPVARAPEAAPMAVKAPTSLPRAPVQGAPSPPVARVEAPVEGARVKPTFKLIHSCNLQGEVEPCG